jgi:hypothetical protein
MRTLSRCRERLADWRVVIAEAWQYGRDEMGRRVSKSKRREIAELQALLGQVKARVSAIEIAQQLEQLTETMTEASRKRSGPVRTVEERPARPDETCSCGRPAAKVFSTPDGGEVAFCDDPDSCKPTG